MTKSKLILKDHAVLPGEMTIEVWYEDRFIATVTGADGPGVRVMTKYPMDIIRGGQGEMVGMIEVRVEPS
jgi:hypothetical protein